MTFCREMWRLGWWLLFLDKIQNLILLAAKKPTSLERLIHYAKLYNCYYFDWTAKTPLVIHISSISHSELGTVSIFLFPNLSHAELVDVLLTTYMHAPEHPYISANGLGSGYSSIAEKERERRSAFWNRAMLEQLPKTQQQGQTERTLHLVWMQNQPFWLCPEVLAAQAHLEAVVGDCRATSYHR